MQGVLLHHNQHFHHHRHIPKPYQRQRLLLRRVVGDEDLYQALEASHGSEVERCQTCHTSGVDEGLVLQEGVADLKEGERDEREEKRGEREKGR